GRLKAHLVLAQRLVPHAKRRDNGRIGMQGNARDAGGGAGGHAEEVNKRALGRSHVGIHEDADDLSLAQGFEQAASVILLGKRSVAVQSAIAIHQRVEQRVIEGTDHDVHGITVKRMNKRADLPSAKMRGEKHHSFAAGVSVSKVLEAFINHGAGDILFGIAREESEFGEQAAEADELAAQDSLLLLTAAGGKSNIKVAH